MKRILTIGRSAQCHICINDTTDVVSRVHASLEVNSNGKYFIIDQSRNGTYVNGMRITPNERVSVTRDDVISFAHISDLNWDAVPKSTNVTLWICIIAAIVTLLTAAAVLLSVYFIGGRNKGNLNPTTNTVVSEDPAYPEILTPEDQQSEDEEEGEENQDAAENKTDSGKKAAEPSEKQDDKIYDAIF